MGTLYFQMPKVKKKRHRNTRANAIFEQQRNNGGKVEEMDKDTITVASKIIASIERHYIMKANKEKAAWYKTKWTKNQYDFYGLSFPIRRTEDKKVNWVT